MSPGYFAENIEVVFFFYGQAFVVLGFLILSQLRQTTRSEFRLLNILWLLALFGIIHGANEFVDMLIIIKGAGFALELVVSLLLISSYFFLLAFGYQLVNLSRPSKLGIWFPATLVILFLVLPIYYDATSLTVWGISARYFLGFPAGILAAVGFSLYYQNVLRGFGLESVRKYFVLTTFFLGTYSIFAGLIVAKADFFPASVINQDSFTALVGIPPQVFRALAALGTAWSIWHVMSIFNIKQDTERRQEKELSDALNSVNAAITSTLDFDEIMQRATIESMKAMGCEAGTVIMRKNDQWVASYVAGEISTDFVGKSVTDEEMPFISPAIESRRPIFSNDTHNDARFKREKRGKYRVRSFLGVPLFVKDEVFGILYFIYYSAPVAFTKVKIDFAFKLGASLSLAIENARLYATERNISGTLQQALLELPERIPGIKFGSLYRSASAEDADVGGDFYDLFELERNKVGLVVGDVSGKGLAAAKLTSYIKSAVKVSAFLGLDPAGTMERTSELVRRTITDETSFITIFFGVLDTGSGALAYSNAGHPPPIIRTEAGVRSLKANSPAISVLTGSGYVVNETLLADRDILIAYTDGVIEARSGADFFGEERLLDLIRDLKAPSAQYLPEQILRMLIDNCYVLRDDIAILTVSFEKRA